jgi:ankyrin repeat and BTB/POZ domain-containing protein 1
MKERHLHLACRSGNLEVVQFYVDIEKWSLFELDEWDSSPLYYACLAGHLPVVEFLLSRGQCVVPHTHELGARCDEATFDGSRCLYAALTQEIRISLRNHARVEHEPDEFAVSMKALFQTGLKSDVTFSFGPHLQPLALHRFILAARSNFFADLFASKWRGQALVQISSPRMTRDVFNSLARFIYTGALHCQRAILTDVIGFAKRCGFDALAASLKRLPPAGSGVVSVEVEASRVVAASLAAASADFSNTPFSDLTLRAEGAECACHRAMLLVRSPVFRAMLGEGFVEGNVSVVDLADVDGDTLRSLLFYFYANELADVDADTIVRLLAASERFLVPGLKSLCVTKLTAWINDDNVMDVLELARALAIDRLERSCVRHVAKFVDAHLLDARFQKHVLADAAAIKGRQEFDSIPIVDELRWVREGEGLIP